MVMIDGAMSFTPKEAIKGKQLWSFDKVQRALGETPGDQQVITGQ